MQAGEQSEIFCVERKRKKTLEFYLAKLSFISAGEMNIFSDKQKLRDFVIRKLSRNVENLQKEGNTIGQKLRSFFFFNYRSNDNSSVKGYRKEKALGITY